MTARPVLIPVSYTHLDVYKRQLIDCMPSLGMITINALAAADSVIIPTPVSYTHLDVYKRPDLERLVDRQVEESVVVVRHEVGAEHALQRLKHGLIGAL